MRTATLVLALLACQSSEPDAEPVPVDTDTTPPIPDTGTPDTVDDTGTPPVGSADVLGLPRLSTVQNGRFSTSDTCASCHETSAGASAMKDAAGRAIGPSDLWQSSMMANSARDPLWRAVVSAEVAATPAARDAIEAKCTRCHMPMASADAELVGGPPTNLDLLTDGSDRGYLALDGVSCTMCHQIEDSALGTEASFSGGYTVLGASRIYGPHTNPFTNPMVMETGFTPTASGHILSSELCATCHTLETHALAPDGSSSGGDVLEQGPYLEWLASDWADPVTGATCADCHLPLVDVDGNPISTRIARNPMGMDFPPISPRSPYGRHVLVGGNTLVPALLRDNAALLNPVGDAAAFDATLAAARTQLEERTATLQLDGVTLAGDALSFDARIESLAGHKLPTGIPLRRVWLHVTVEDATGAVVFESGGFDGDGRILGPDGAPLPSEAASGPISPHVDTVADGSTVPIYEGILADEAGAPTFLLMRGAGWAKDDRLLPRGWDATVADPRSVPVGVGADADFGPGGDTVAYTVDVAGAPRPLTVRAEVLYQPLSARWRAEIVASATPEALGLDVLLDAADLAPEVLATSNDVVP